jgi:hypothetical protein
MLKVLKSGTLSFCFGTIGFLLGTLGFCFGTLGFLLGTLGFCFGTILISVF